MKVVKRIVSVLIAILLIFSAVITSAAYGVEDGYNPEYIYRDIVMDFLGYNPDSMESEGSGYEELYFHSLDDEATPDYVLIFAHNGYPAPAYSFGVFGDYVISSDWHNDYPLGYYILVPEENNRIYTLTEAWEAGIEDIEAIFTETNLGSRIGDMDGDRSLTVRDATCIQKFIAGIQDYSIQDSFIGLCVSPSTEFHTDSVYISDFNRDEECNIKDATAIQKEIAGIDWKEGIDSNHRPAYEYHCVLIFSTKDKPILTVEDFPEYDFASIELEMYEDYSDIVLYKLILSISGKRNVLEAVEALKYREGVDFDWVQPNYLYYID